MGKWENKIGKKMMFYNLKKRRKVSAVVEDIIYRRGKRGKVAIAVASDGGTKLYRILGKA